MSILQRWASTRRQRKIDARKVFIEEVGWTAQIPLSFVPRNLANAQRKMELAVKRMGGYSSDSIYRDGNIHVLFDADFNKFNRMAGSLSSISSHSPDQIAHSRQESKGRMVQILSRIPQSVIERNDSTCMVGGLLFDKHSFLVIRNGKPIICIECIYQIVGEYELSVSVTYNNETCRQEMIQCLEESQFIPNASSSPGSWSPL